MQDTAGGNGNQDIGLRVTIRAAADNDRIANFRYYDGSTYSSRLVIQRDGNVGIGTDAPEYRLDLSTPANTEFESNDSSIRFGVNNNLNQLGPGIIWEPQYINYTKRSAGILQIGDAAGYFDSSLAFYTNNSTNTTGDWSERLRITSDGTQDHKANRIVNSQTVNDLQSGASFWFDDVDDTIILPAGSNYFGTGDFYFFARLKIFNRTIFNIFFYAFFDLLIWLNCLNSLGKAFPY